MITGQVIMFWTSIATALNPTNQQQQRCDAISYLSKVVNANFLIQMHNNNAWAKMVTVMCNFVYVGANGAGRERVSIYKHPSSA